MAEWSLSESEVAIYSCGLKKFAAEIPAASSGKIRGPNLINNNNNNNNVIIIIIVILQY